MLKQKIKTSQMKYALIWVPMKVMKVPQMEFEKHFVFKRCKTKRTSEVNEPRATGNKVF